MIDCVIKQKHINHIKVVCLFISFVYKVAKTNEQTIKISARKCHIGIGFLQYLHLPLKHIKLIIGIKSKKFKTCLQLQHIDLFPVKFISLFSLNILKPKKVEKLPKIAPKTIETNKWKNIFIIQTNIEYKNFLSSFKFILNIFVFYISQNNT